eukprot:CAMPEP_0168441368 /NCGR_PEP_ID=MMETSP0228-20121227/43455_1 /TAXON_ID=133427 /ORGANISM="Protoceratium reticulatum, Strain CCCM 535 (=CCMP 1889)" /LENGTH=49 /DNA_ID= /DNA_START= /DNA_END= /DNA_ORIENTATION=
MALRSARAPSLMCARPALHADLPAALPIPPPGTACCSGTGGGTGAARLR